MSDHVLIVDDNRVNRAIIEKVAESMEIDTESADSASSAMKSFLSNRPFALVVDVHMPKINGLQFLQQLVELNEENSEIPTLVVTGDTAVTMKDACMQDAYVIHKPLNTRDLVDALNRLREKGDKGA